MGGILKILSWAYLKYCQFIWWHTVSVSCSYRRQILHIWLGSAGRRKFNYYVENLLRWATEVGKICSDWYPVIILCKADGPCITFISSGYMIDRGQSGKKLSASILPFLPFSFPSTPHIPARGLGSTVISPALSGIEPGRHFNLKGLFCCTIQAVFVVKQYTSVYC